MDRDDAPGALDAELREEGGGDDGVGGGVRVRVEEGAADDTHDDDGEAAAEDLGGVADDGPAAHGAEVRDDLDDGDGVCGFRVLVD